MRKSTVTSCAFLVLAGLASAAAAAFIPLPLTVGLAYGIAIALYFVLAEGQRNLLKVVAFITASASAFLIAFFAAVFLSGIFPHDTDSARIGVPVPVFACAGFLGAYLVLAAALYLFGPQIRSGWSSLRILLWALGGAVLGGLGAMADRTFIDSSQNRSFLLYLIWQPGVALLIGLMLAAERRLSTFQPQEEAVTESSVFELGWSRLVPAGIVFAVLFGFLGWFGIREIQSKLLMARLDQAHQRRLAEAPSLVNLPPVEAIPPEQALIVHEIAGLQPSKPYSRAWNRPGQPPIVEYDVSYDSAEQPSGPNPSPVMVQLTQMPNAAWSRYSIEDLTVVRPDVVTRVAKFNSRVIQSTAGPIIGSLCYSWTSANFFVAVCYNTPQREEEFINQYLQKYPSSL